jgi:hypothetical protein
MIAPLSDSFAICAKAGVDMRRNLRRNTERWAFKKMGWKQAVQLDGHQGGCAAAFAPG